MSCMIKNEDRINEIIQELKNLEVDGETTEYIITQLGMEDQMVKQLHTDKEL